MPLRERLTDFLTGNLLAETRRDLRELRETALAEARHNAVLRERNYDLESEIARDGFVLLAGLLGQIVVTDRVLRLARHVAFEMYTRNPYIRRGVDAKCDFVIGEGLNVSSANAAVNAVLQDFWDDYTNQTELTTADAMRDKEREQQLFGETFFVLFTNARTGAVKVATIFPDEIQGMPIYNPENRRECWYYKRVRFAPILDLTTGIETQAQLIEWHPDWRYQPRVKPDQIGGYSVRWDAPVYHVKTGAINRMDRGLSEVVAQIGWAKAYTEFLENRATVARALSRIVAKATAATKAGVAAVRKGLASLAGRRSDIGPDGSRLGDAVGDVATMGPGKDYEPVNVKGATINPDEGRRFLLAVCAGFGLPETWFGDASVGTLATASSLDLPTMKMMKARRALWTQVLQNILHYVVLKSATAPAGALRNVVKVDWGGTQPKLSIAGRPVPVDVDFPSLIETETAAEIAAVASAATLLPGEAGRRFVAKKILGILGEDDIDQMLAGMEFGVQMGPR